MFRKGNRIDGYSRHWKFTHIKGDDEISIEDYSYLIYSGIAPDGKRVGYVCFTKRCSLKTLRSRYSSVDYHWAVKEKALKSSTYVLSIRTGDFVEKLGELIPRDLVRELGLVLSHYEKEKQRLRSSMKREERLKKKREQMLRIREYVLEDYSNSVNILSDSYVNKYTDGGVWKRAVREIKIREQGLKYDINTTSLLK